VRVAILHRFQDAEQSPGASTALGNHLVDECLFGRGAASVMRCKHGAPFCEVSTLPLLNLLFG
jgi:hypothetical protein